MKTKFAVVSSATLFINGLSGEERAGGRAEGTEAWWLALVLAPRWFLPRVRSLPALVLSRPCKYRRLEAGKGMMEDRVLVLAGRQPQK